MAGPQAAPAPAAGHRQIDFSDYEPETVYLSREYELECLTE